MTLATLSPSAHSTAESHPATAHTPPPPDSASAQAVSALIAELGNEVPVEVIEQCVAHEAHRLRGARITVFLGILLHKAARERLRDHPTAGSIPPRQAGLPAGTGRQA